MLKHLARLLTTGLVALAAVSASAAEIVDRGEFFTAEAMKSANRTVSELESKYRRQIHIETYAAVPSDKAAAVAKMSKAERDAFYVSWIKDRAKATKAQGLFVLVTKEPAHIHVRADQLLERQGFTSQSRQHVVEAMAVGFREKKFDEGLSQGLAQIGTEFGKLSGTSATAHSRTLPPAPMPQQSPRVRHAPSASGNNYGGIVMIGLLIVGGLILLSVLGRAFSGGGMGGAPGMGGGGFGTGLMGGLLGALAGNWLYNSFSGHHGQAFGGEQQSNLGDDGGSGAGDFGGNDFGGGADFGGGDFGGGDFGGGGDF